MHPTTVYNVHLNVIHVYMLAIIVYNVLETEFILYVYVLMVIMTMRLIHHAKNVLHTVNHVNTKMYKYDAYHVA